LDLLLVEHDPERARAATAVLRAAGHRVDPVPSAEEGLARLSGTRPPDLVLFDERGAGLDAHAFLQALDRMGGAPAVVVLGADGAGATWVEGARTGLADYVTTDPDGAWLTTLAARLEGTRERARRHDRDARLADALDSTSAAVLLVDRTARLEYANSACARLLGRRVSEILDVTLVEVADLEADPRLKADLFTALDLDREWAGELDVRTKDGGRVPCIATLSPIRRRDGRMDGHVLTLRDVTDRIAIEEALRAANRRLAEQAARDPLTGIFNRGYFRDVLDREIARSVRYRDELALLMLDLDGFKLINDDHGHDAGDLTLQQVAKVLGAGLREGDVLCRYGGDEFCVLLPNTTAELARTVAERLRMRVREGRYGAAGDLRLTVSVGFATSAEARGETPALDLLRLADQAMLKAKRDGGDRSQGASSQGASGA
jgi:diguanylate cyclase (GGDEF)-like protein/PAS domain S-box-containing protein